MLYFCTPYNLKLMFNKEIKELHSKGMTDTEIATVLNLPRKTINYYRKKLGLLTPVQQHLKNIETYVIEELKNGFSIYSISKKYKCSICYIRNLAKKLNIKTTTKKEFINKVKKVKNNVFQNLNNNEVQYWLGFLCADGSIFEDRVSLGLQEKDYDHLVKFQNFLKTNVSILKSNKKANNKIYYLYKISFRNKEIVTFLKNLGITNKKTFTLDYKGEFTFDFLRGVIDGDGYIRKNHNEVSIVSASPIFINQIKNFYDLNNIESKILNPKENIYTISVFGKNKVNYLLNKLYKNAHTYLNRKYENAILSRNT